MIAYASRTGTRRNLGALRAAGWRLLISAQGVHRDEGFPYAIDNGAWSCFQQERPFDPDPFCKLLASHGNGADWIVVPDVVADARASLVLTEKWISDVARYSLPLVAVQDGMAEDDVASWLHAAGLFLGGSTEWKLETMPYWGEVAARHGCHYHVARISSRKRMVRAQLAGADSFDTSSPSRYVVELPKLEDQRSQNVLPLGIGRNR